MSTIAQGTDTREARGRPESESPDLQFSLKELAWWLGELADHLNDMPQIQRRELQRACRGVRRDLHEIRLGIPEATR